MRLKDKITGISRWDSYSLVILVLAVVFQAFRWKIFPIFIDVYYHLLTAVGFNEAGGWVGSCFWEFAPVGRPQIYPPLLHIIMLFLLKLGLPIILIGKLTQFLIYPLLIFVIWYVIRDIFDKKLAFFVLVMIFSMYPFYLVAINTLAASLSLVFCLLSLLFLEKKKSLTSAILLSLAFYTHGFTPWIFWGIFLFYGFYLKERLKSCLKICFLALFFASPLIFYQVAMLKFYVFTKNILENYYIEINILHWSIFLLGLFACFKKKGRYYIFVFLFLAFIPLLFRSLIFRYFSFYGTMSLVFINAVFLSNTYDKLTERGKKRYLAVIFVLFFILSPTFSIDLLEKDKKSDSVINEVYKNLIFKKGSFALNLLDSNVSNFIFYCSRQVRSNEVTIYFPRLFFEVVDVIKRNSTEKDIIYLNFSYTAGILGLLSQRATSTAMLSEIKPYRNFDQVAVSRLVIWQKDPLNMKGEPISLINRYQLKKIADTKLAFVYENPRCIFKKQTLTAVISYRIIFLLIFLFFALMAWSLKFGIDKN